MSDYLPPEVVGEILSRLPVKSLLKFRCVRKSWNDLITSSHFISKHLNQAKSDKLLLVRYFPVRYLSSPTPNSVKEQFLLRFDDDSFGGYAKFKCPFVATLHFRIVGICNGLVCLSDDLFGYTDTVIIWNPAIHRYLSLPKPKVNAHENGYNIFAIGFGFDSRNNDYKVVRLTYLEKSQSNECVILRDTPIVEIYSVSTCCWRTKKDRVPSVGIIQFFWEQVFLNGSVHWLAYKKNDDNNSARNVLLLFDLAKEKFRVLEFPEVFAKDEVMLANVSVGLHKESLALFVYQRYRNPCTSFEVYVMEEYGVVESWSKMLNVTDFEVGISNVLGFRENGELLLVTLANELVSYDPNSMGAKKLGICGVKESVYAGAYAESLVLLNGLKGRLASQVKTYKISADPTTTANLRLTREEYANTYLSCMRFSMACDSYPRF